MLFFSFFFLCWLFSTSFFSEQRRVLEEPTAGSRRLRFAALVHAFAFGVALAFCFLPPRIYRGRLFCFMRRWPAFLFPASSRPISWLLHSVHPPLLPTSYRTRPEVAGAAQFGRRCMVADEAQDVASLSRSTSLSVDTVPANSHSNELRGIGL